MPSPLSIVWFRRDLRLDDNPALADAARRGAVLPLFIWPGEDEQPWPPGAASRWWLRQSLRSLDEQLRRGGSRLLVCDGPPLAALRRVAAASGARQVLCNRSPEPAAAGAESRLAGDLARAGIELKFHDPAWLLDPQSILNQQSQPYRVFTAFWNRCLRAPQPARPIEAPRQLPSPPSWPQSLDGASRDRQSGGEFSGSLERHWQPGEQQARALLEKFLRRPLARYLEDRHLPHVLGTSQLSPYLHFGEISPRRIWSVVREHAAGDTGRAAIPAAEGFLRQLIWREFACYILHHFPRTPRQPSNAEFARFPWRRDTRALRAWRQGRTGYPLVDAGMRQLAASGWMHNRLRMIVASFLTKHLLLSWRSGARWFWERLVDADLANNTFGWQWAAGCGHDAAPYFRIFNPVLQGRRFDPQGEFVRRWVPELARLPERWIHQPWAAPRPVLEAAGVRLGLDYPKPIVEHEPARARALRALARARGAATAAAGARR